MEGMATQRLGLENIRTVSPLNSVARHTTANRFSRSIFPVGRRCRDITTSHTMCKQSQLKYTGRDCGKSPRDLRCRLTRQLVYG
ncbi:hypothetical protein PM082_006086 [Marasmius tenuissimus]|nr:hypothetical protein PM082_006086 [Marasmius tenuissimus]